MGNKKSIGNAVDNIAITYGASWGTGNIEGNTNVYDCLTTKLYT